MLNNSDFHARVFRVPAGGILGNHIAPKLSQGCTRPFYLWLPHSPLPSSLKKTAPQHLRCFYKLLGRLEVPSDLT